MDGKEIHAVRKDFVEENGSTPFWFVHNLYRRLVARSILESFVAYIFYRFEERISMKATTILAGGLAGATAVTLLHESIRQVVPQAPRMDRLGMQAISKGLKKAGKKVPREN